MNVHTKQQKIRLNVILGRAFFGTCGAVASSWGGATSTGFSNSALSDVFVLTIFSLVVAAGACSWIWNVWPCLRYAQQTSIQPPFRAEVEVQARVHRANKQKGLLTTPTPAGTATCTICPDGSGIWIICPGPTPAGHWTSMVVGWSGGGTVAAICAHTATRVRDWWHCVAGTKWLDALSLPLSDIAPSRGASRVETATAFSCGEKTLTCRRRLDLDLEHLARRNACWHHYLHRLPRRVLNLDHLPRADSGRALDLHRPCRSAAVPLCTTATALVFRHHRRQRRALF
jgi:hypothetical protein